jgi:hypothetical protein
LILCFNCFLCFTCSPWSCCHPLVVFPCFLSYKASLHAFFHVSWSLVDSVRHSNAPNLLFTAVLNSSLFSLSLRDWMLNLWCGLHIWFVFESSKFHPQGSCNQLMIWGCICSSSCPAI